MKQPSAWEGFSIACIERPSTDAVERASRQARRILERNRVVNVPGTLGLHIGEWCYALEELVRLRRAARIRSVLVSVLWMLAINGFLLAVLLGGSH